MLNFKRNKCAITILSPFSLLALPGFSKHFLASSDVTRQIAYFLIVAYQLYLPIFITRRYQKKPKDYAIWAHGLFSRKFNPQSFKLDIKRVLMINLVTLPAYALGVYFLQHMETSKYGIHGSFMPQFSWSLLYYFFLTTLLIALSKEIFYRGYMQTSLLKTLPNKTNIFRFLPGIAILIVGLFFALKHFVGDYYIARLAMFFPGLAFLMLAFKSGSILETTLFDGLCNTSSEFLHQAYVWQ